MAKVILKTFMAFLCLYGFTNSQDLDTARMPSSDIQFDQEPALMYSGDGKIFNTDDEDYGVSGSGSGSGVGIYDPDVEIGDVFKGTTTTTTTTTSSTTTTTAAPPLRKEMSKCEIQRERSKHTLTSNVPKCLDNGDFAALQCLGHRGTADCYCVDLDGRRIPGTLMERPNYPNCEEGYNLPKCTHQLVLSTRSGLYGKRRPSCTSEGYFEQVQCHGSMCFCVDPYTGAPVPGTEKRLPDKPHCGEESEEETSRPLRPDLKEPGLVPYERDSMDGDVGFQEEGSETIDLDQNGDRIYTSDSGDEGDEAFEGLPNTKFGGEVLEGGQDVEGDDWSDSSSEEGEDTGRGGTQDSSHGQKDRVENASEILTQPGILAGIIGGVVVLLLCLVLLIMFIVYRMRKKDEGSYPLDEPRRGPPNYSYVRAPDKEYYA